MTSVTMILSGVVSSVSIRLTRVSVAIAVSVTVLLFISHLGVTVPNNRGLVNSSPCCTVSALVLGIGDSGLDGGLETVLDGNCCTFEEVVCGEGGIEGGRPVVGGWCSGGVGGEGDGESGRRGVGGVGGNGRSGSCGVDGRGGNTVNIGGVWSFLTTIVGMSFNMALVLIRRGECSRCFGIR